VIFLWGDSSARQTSELPTNQPAGWQEADAEWHWKLFYYGAIYKTITLICAPFNSSSLHWQSISGCFYPFSETLRNSRQPKAGWRYSTSFRPDSFGVEMNTRASRSTGRKIIRKQKKYPKANWISSIIYFKHDFFI